MPLQSNNLLQAVNHTGLCGSCQGEDQQKQYLNYSFQAQVFDEGKNKMNELLRCRNV